MRGADLYVTMQSRCKRNRARPRSSARERRFGGVERGHDRPGRGPAGQYRQARRGGLVHVQHVEPRRSCSTAPHPRRWTGTRSSRGPPSRCTARHRAPGVRDVRRQRRSSSAGASTDTRAPAGFRCSASPGRVLHAAGDVRRRGRPRRSHGASTGRAGSTGPRIRQVQRLPAPAPARLRLCFDSRLRLRLCLRLGRPRRIQVGEEELLQHVPVGRMRAMPSA